MQEMSRSVFELQTTYRWCLTGYVFSSGYQNRERKARRKGRTCFLSWKAISSQDLQTLLASHCEEIHVKYTSQCLIAQNKAKWTAFNRYQGDMKRAERDSSLNA